MQSWMRMPVRLTFMIAAAGVVFGTPPPAKAADSSISGGSFSLVIGALPAISFAQNPDPTAVTLGAGNAFQQPLIFAGNVILAKDLFTGVNLITSLNVTLIPPVTPGSFAPGGGQAAGFGGASGLNGQSIIGVLGGVLNLVVPLGVVGTGGTTKAAAFQLAVTVTGAKWTTGVVTITGITTTTTMPNGTINILNTVTNTAGTDVRTPGGAGLLVLVSPARILTNAAGNLPSFAVQQLTFAPEPTRALLWAAAAGALWAVGRLRRRS